MSFDFSFNMLFISNFPLTALQMIIYLTEITKQLADTNEQMQVKNNHH
jgi:hypothetical protein